MRYVSGHKARTRDRIVEQASYGLREKGAEGLSVPSLMKLAGLTHGGFYCHFDSRAALVAEAIAYAIDQTAEHWKQLTKGKTVRQRFDAIVADYLSERHRDNPKRGCPLPTLAADVGRSNLRTRRTFARKLEQMIQIIAELLPDESPEEARQIATGVIATMVGSVLLSRAVDSTAVSNGILDAGRKTADAMRGRRASCTS
jgi:TetR/AcrR family transcriptional repressor of nem operon